MYTTSSSWHENGQLQEQDAWCWAATTSMMRDCFGAGAAPQAQIVHDWLMSDTAQPGDRTENYRAWVEFFEIDPPTWDNVRESIAASEDATTLMNEAYGNSLPGVTVEYASPSEHDLAAIVQHLEQGQLYVLGSDEHWYTLYGADLDTGQLLVWDPMEGAIEGGMDWFGSMNAFLVTGYHGA